MTIQFSCDFFQINVSYRYYVLWLLTRGFGWTATVAFTKPFLCMSEVRKVTEFSLKLKFLQHKLVITYSSNDTVSIMTSAWSSSFYGKVLLCAVFAPSSSSYLNCHALSLLFAAIDARNVENTLAWNSEPANQAWLWLFAVSSLCGTLKNASSWRRWVLLDLLMTYLLRYLNGHD